MDIVVVLLLLFIRNRDDVLGLPVRANSGTRQ